MNDIGMDKSHRLDSYDYQLPEGLIAQEPARARTESSLMVLDRGTGTMSHARFSDLTGLLTPGDCLVVNDTRVVPARLYANKPTGGRVELLMLRYEERHFHAMFRTHRGLRTGTCLEVVDRRQRATGDIVRVNETFSDGTISGILEEKEETNRARQGLSRESATGIRSLLRAFGMVPVPPYIRRSDGSRHELDSDRYQTVYAREEGAVAAPTAGLHFSLELMDELGRMGVEVASLTLHVGPGTFKPITALDIRDHNPGTERFSLPADTADCVNRAIKEGRRVIAVGTTVVRTLEAMWSKGLVKSGLGETDLYIAPGFRFNVVSSMITNFHLPGSSLLVLVSAFAGRSRILEAYREAVSRGYRFYSYGDAMFII